MAASADESMDWLKALEKRVSAVTTEMADLRKKNRSLVTKVNRLERQARDRSGWQRRRRSSSASRAWPAVSRVCWSRGPAVPREERSWGKRGEEAVWPLRSPPHRLTAQKNGAERQARRR
jgi:hypothetical protein